MKKILVATVLFSIFQIAFAEQISFTAEKMSGQAGNSSTTTTLEGNAAIQTSSIEIKAQNITLSGDDYRNIIGKDAVSGKNKETNMEFSCDSLEYDRITKIVILRGNVSLIDVDNDVKAEAQIVEYNQDKNIAVMQIQIKLIQKDNVCSGAYAIYHKEEQLLEISGNAQVKQKDDVFRAQYITLDLNSQDITLGGNVKGTVTESKSKAEETKVSDKKDDSKDNNERADALDKSENADTEITKKEEKQ